jgi:hypothetical protein
MFGALRCHWRPRAVVPLTSVRVFMTAKHVVNKYEASAYSVVAIHRVASAAHRSR